MACTYVRPYVMAGVAGAAGAAGAAGHLYLVLLLPPHVPSLYQANMSSSETMLERG